MTMHALDNEDFVKTVRVTGRETVMDASGDPREMASRTKLARLSRATTNAVLSEVHWRQTNMLERASPQKLGIDGNDHRAKRHQNGAVRR
jgi:hypothetical protein